MDSNDLTREQIQKIQDFIAPRSRYLLSIRERMENTCFPREDKHRQSVEKAHEALHELWIHLH